MQEPEAILKKNASERRWHEIATYLVALVLCLLMVEWLVKPRRADPPTHFLYVGDGLYHSMLIKAVITNGWYLTNPRLGAPHGQELYDFPYHDNLSFLLIKLMGLFTSNYATVFNLYYLLTFPLTTICALYVFRKFGVSRGPAIMSSLLYTFTLYHLDRGYQLMYTAYYHVPLMVMVILWVCGEKLSLTGIEDGRGKSEQATSGQRKPRILMDATDQRGLSVTIRRIRENLWLAPLQSRLFRFKSVMRDHKLIAGLLICVLIASTGGAYYSFFAIWLLASAALFLAVRHRSGARMITPVILIVVIFGVFLANMAPNLIYFMKHGRTEVAERKAAEAEIYGLKIAQLLLPASDHRVKSLADFKARYDLSPLNTENVDSTLGFIGGFGFLFLIGWLLYRKGRDEPDQPQALFNHLSMLNASAVLIGTVGGFGSVFAHLISPQIRAYNRISVFIAFFSFFAVALLLDLLSRRFFQRGARRTVFYVLVLTLTALGALDQTGRRSRPDYNDIKAEYLSDRDFIRRIESEMPRDAMIFQLPVQSFPEGDSKDHLKAYLHSDSSRWSFGAIDLREGANWQATVAAAPVDEMIDTIALAGFSGVYIDRAQYQDKGAKIEAAISGLLQSAPLLSRNQRLSFFSLIEYRKKLGGDPEKALRPLSLKWPQGFYEKEGSPEDNWRWCSTAGELLIENLSLSERKAIIEMGASSINSGRLRIESRDFSEVIQINSVNTPFSKKLVIPPGAYSIRFISDAPAASPPPETRALSFRINNFKLKEVER